MSDRDEGRTEKMDIRAGVRADGTIEDHFVETVFLPIQSASVDDRGFLRFVADGGFTDYEFRLSFDDIRRFAAKVLRAEPSGDVGEEDAERLSIPDEWIRRYHDDPPFHYAINALCQMDGPAEVLAMYVRMQEQLDRLRRTPETERRRPVWQTGGWKEATKDTRSQEPVGWQPWHTCPKDGRKVLAHFKDGWADTVCRDHDGSWWFAYDGDRLNQEPTHWRPFVGPPIGDEE